MDANNNCIEYDNYTINSSWVDLHVGDWEHK